MAAPTIGTRQIAVNGAVYRVLDRPRRKLWARLAEGRWEPGTFAYLEAVCRPGTVFLDLGAWIGLIALHADRLGASVVAVEPDPVALEELRQNIALNGAGVRVVPRAVDTGAGPITLSSRTELGASVTSSLGLPGDRRIAVEALTLAALAAEIPRDRPLAIKVDVEGHEYRLGRALAALSRERDCPIHLSLHPESLVRSLTPRLGPLAHPVAAWRTVRLLARFRGHRWHLETGAPLRPAHLLWRLSRWAPKDRNFTVIGWPRGHAPSLKRAV